MLLIPLLLSTLVLLYSILRYLKYCISIQFCASSPFLQCGLEFGMMAVSTEHWCDQRKVSTKAGQAEYAWLGHIDRQQKTQKRRFCHSRRHLMQLEWLSKAHGEGRFIGSRSAAKPSTRATRRAMRAWEHFSAVREKVLLPSGGRIWTAFGRVDGTAGIPILTECSGQSSC